MINYNAYVIISIFLSYVELQIVTTNDQQLFKDMLVFRKHRQLFTVKLLHSSKNISFAENPFNIQVINMRAMENYFTIFFFKK